MVIKGLERDLNEDKAQIDAEGFDFLKLLAPTCHICGNRIKWNETVSLINGVMVCEDCGREA